MAAVTICSDFGAQDLLHSVWRVLGSATSLQLTQIHSLLWLIFHCLYGPHLLYSFIYQWTSNCEQKSFNKQKPRARWLPAPLVLTPLVSTLCLPCLCWHHSPSASLPVASCLWMTIQCCVLSPRGLPWPSPTPHAACSRPSLVLRYTRVCIVALYLIGMTFSRVNGKGILCYCLPFSNFIESTHNPVRWMAVTSFGSGEAW